VSEAVARFAREHVLAEPAVAASKSGKRWFR
jgi:hypothetical protein